MTYNRVADPDNIYDNPPETYFFYDLETTGLSASEDRIMQFAGQRTDLTFHPIGPPINWLVQLSDDTLPGPWAIATTHILPQTTLHPPAGQESITERELCRRLMRDIFTPNTIILGYNSIRFDDGFIRHLFWRNFYDPYAWQWRDGRSRWDMLDVVRLTRALRPDGINWPISEDGKPNNRLENLTKANDISHESAHDALSDVNALIAVAKLIHDKQPELYNNLFGKRDKKVLAALVNPAKPQPFVYSSGAYGSAHNFTTIAVPIAYSPRGNALVFDLRYDAGEILGKISASERRGLHPVVKELAYNKCPAIAPCGVLKDEAAWSRIDLDHATVKRNLSTLKEYKDELIDQFNDEQAAREEKYQPKDGEPREPEAALYDGFLNDYDVRNFPFIQNADALDLASFSPDFRDPRLPTLFVHYKAKNFPDSLTPAESTAWQTYRRQRLARQQETFDKDLATLSARHQPGDAELITALRDWAKYCGL